MVDLPVAPADLTAFEFEDQFGVVRSVEQYVTDGHVDALLLWHDGAIRQEVFRNGQTPRSRHIVFSVTKSFTGLLAEMLIDRGVLDKMTAPIEHLLRNCVTHGIEMPDARQAVGEDCVVLRDENPHSLALRSRV